MRSARRWLAIGATATMVIAGCGDDDDEAATPSVEDYCAAIDSIGDDLPTEAQMDEILAVAPEEIAENLEIVITAIREKGEESFGDPAVLENFAPIEAFEAENCGGGEAAAEVDPDATRVDVAATEYAFSFDPPPGGAVSFVVTNDGEELHEMILARFVGDATVEDALASEDPEAEGLVESVGFAGPIAPGAETVLNVEDLTPGRYVVVCMIPAGDGEPHGAKGMLEEFTVS